MTPRLAYLLAGLTVLAGAAVLSDVRTLMIIGGLPLALLLPGAALTALLFRDPQPSPEGNLDLGPDRALSPGAESNLEPSPQRNLEPSPEPGLPPGAEPGLPSSSRPGPRRLLTLERILLIPLLSLGTLVLGGLLVWAAGAPLDRTTWLALTAGVTLAGLAAVVLRELRTTAVPAERSTSALAAVREEGRMPELREERHTPELRDDARAPDLGDDVRPPDLGDDARPPDLRDDARPPDLGDDARAPGVRNQGRQQITSDLEFRPEPMDRRRRLTRQVLPAALSAVLLAGGIWLSLGTSIRSNDATVTTLSVAPPAAGAAEGQRSVQVSASGLSAGEDAYQLVVTTATGTGGTSVAVTADGRGSWSSTLQLPADDRLTLVLRRAGESTALRTVIVASEATG